MKRVVLGVLSRAEGAVAASGLWRAAALSLSWKVDAIRTSNFLHTAVTEEV